MPKQKSVEIVIETRRQFFAPAHNALKQEVINTDFEPMLVADKAKQEFKQTGYVRWASPQHKSFEPAAFACLLAQLSDEPEQAGQQYLSFHARLTKFFECRGCPIAPELADATLLRLARRLLGGLVIPPAGFPPYLYGIARNVLREFNKSCEKGFIPFDELPTTQHPTQAPLAQTSETTQRERILFCMESCLQEFPPESKQLLLNYYSAEGHQIAQRKELAAQLGISANALKIRLCRLRTILAQRLSERLTALPDL